MFKYMMISGFVSLLALGGSTLFYKSKSERLSEDVQELESELSAHKRAAELAVNLRAQNELLEDERDMLERELLDAEDYDHPLSPTIRSTLDRLREGSGTDGFTF